MMSIERHLHATATAVSELWTDENDTRARLAALRERASRETSDHEQPQAPSRAPRTTSARPSPGSHDPRRGSEPPLNEVQFLTVAEVASVMGVSKMTVYRLISSGHLPAIHVGSSFRVPEQAVHEYLRESSQAANVDGL
jgi:excisionase family DNA binding protein